jgi:hypothetical protein
MTRRSRIAVVAIALAAWWVIGRVRGTPTATDPAAQPAAVTDRTISPGLTGTAAGPRVRRSLALPVVPDPASAEVTIAGRVFDLVQQAPVGNVEVVFHGEAGETSTTTRDDGAYSIRLASGAYRAFVRDDTVLSVGRPEAVRLPGQPSADAAGAPDDALMTLVLATADTEGVDLTVVRGGVVSGHVVDRDGRPIAGAVLRARGGAVRPALATDIAETDRDGSFELRLPAGLFMLDASHPRFAGIADPRQTRVTVQAGDHLRRTITLTAGCVISGRVVDRGGAIAGDGAIERQWGQGELEFVPAGRIEPDGTFRWVTTENGEIALRAWPWKSPPSPARRFTCRDGAQFDDVVFQLPDRRPELSGILIDSAGGRVGGTYVDIQPLDPGGIGQQERTDADGSWEVYSLPPGRYRVIAQAEGRGVTSQMITSPQSGIRLQLGGTGRLEGTTQLVSGSFELVLETCSDRTTLIALPQTRRLVTVTGGRFAVEGLPACELSFAAIWHGRPIPAQVAIPSGGTAHVELDLGPPHVKTVHGIVRDAAGRPVAGAHITAIKLGEEDSSIGEVATSDASGAYTIMAVSGAGLNVSVDSRAGFATVGQAVADSEQIDVVVEEVQDTSEPDDTPDTPDTEDDAAETQDTAEAQEVPRSGTGQRRAARSSGGRMTQHERARR